MDYITEKQRSIPVRFTTDVLVVGAGPAGAAAAIASARNGAQTLLVERYGFPGGMATAGGVAPFMTSYAGDKQIVKGVFADVVDELVRRGGAISPENLYGGSGYAGYVTIGHDHVTPFLMEDLKNVLLEMLEGAGVKMLLHALCVDTIVEDGAVRGIVVESKSGRLAISAGVVVDATGDGDVAYKAGARFEKGRPGDGCTQPMTLFFSMGGVDTAKFNEAVGRGEILGRLGDVVAKHRGEFIETRDDAGIYFSSRPGQVNVNTTRVNGVDGTNVEDLTRAEIESRKQVDTLVRFFKKYVPGFKNSYLIATAPQIGVRETRRITGEYVIDSRDVIEARDFDDAVARGSYMIDIHEPTGKGTEVHLVEGEKSYGIPYRALVPVEIDNLLTAGRNISCTHEALGSIRVMPTSFATGEAAGVAASIASEKKQHPRDVDVKTLQKKLHQQGAVVFAE